MFQSRKNNKTKGNHGEELAVMYLVNKGYQVLARNWFFGKKEIDIICDYQGFIVFIEVKARNHDYLIEPHQAVNIKKQRHLVKAANAWLIEHDRHQEARFDILSVTYPIQGQPIIEHIENAFYPFS